MGRITVYPHVMLVNNAILIKHFTENGTLYTLATHSSHGGRWVKTFATPEQGKKKVQKQLFKP